MLPLKILFVSPEVDPFVKVGGLADMVGSLPKVLAQRGHDVRVVCPAYGSIKINDDFVARDEPLGVEVGAAAHWGKTWVTHLPDSKVPLYCLEHGQFFDRPEVYAGPWGDHPDNDLRFTFLCRGALTLCQQIRSSPSTISNTRATAIDARWTSRTCPSPSSDPTARSRTARST